MRLKIKLYKIMHYLILVFFLSLVSSWGLVASSSTNTPSLRGEIWYGNASWYGRRFHGKKTSNGEKFNKNKLTAAHKTLPFNTRVLVTSLKNNKSVIVRINDRGPFVGDRIIDLSEAAAKELGLKDQGVTSIRMRVVDLNSGIKTTN